MMLAPPPMLPAEDCLCVAKALVFRHCSTFLLSLMVSVSRKPFLLLNAIKPSSLTNFSTQFTFPTVVLRLFWTAYRHNHTNTYDRSEED